MVRTLYTVAIAFVALTVPHFNVIQALVGGSAIACTSFIFPPLFYYLLSRQSIQDDVSDAGYDDTLDPLNSEQHQANRIRTMGPWFKALLFSFIIVGVAGGLCSTYFAFASLVNGQSGFTVPCYVNATVE